MAIATSTALGIAAVGVSAAAAVNTADNQRKALHSQQDALKAQQGTLGPNGSLEQSTADLAKQNALNSAALEKQLTPEVPLLRQQSNQALLNGMNSGTYDMGGARTSLSANGFGSQLNTPLLNAAIAKAQGDLALGGTLDQETQNAVTRHGLATAAGVAGPGGGLGLGRDVVARDLGLTSLQLQQQRLANASQLGGQELNLGQSNATNLLNHINLLNQINQGEFGRNLATAQYAEGIARPVVGLDPGASANLQIANQNAQAKASANAADVKGQQTQGYMQLAGQGLGALMAYNNRPQVNTLPYNTTSWTPVNGTLTAGNWAPPSDYVSPTSSLAGTGFGY